MSLPGVRTWTAWRFWCAAGFAWGIGSALPVRAGSTYDGPPPGFVPAPRETVEVTTRPVSPESLAARLPYPATIQRLERANERTLTIADLLERTAGVRVRRYGGIGSFATASIRGSSPGEVEIYLDGMPVNSAQWGAANLAELPIENLQRIEVYRGGAPPGFGATGIGGVVNLVTEDPGKERSDFGVAGGSFGTVRATALESGKTHGLAHLVSFRHFRTRGDFPFRYDPGTPDVPGDDQTLRRQNNALHETNFLVKLQPPAIGPWRLELQDDGFLQDGGLAGHGNLLYHAAHFDTRRNRASASLAAGSLVSGRLSTRMNVYSTRQRDRTFNPGREPGLNAADVTNRTGGEGAQLSIAVRWFRTAQTFNLLLDAERERFAPFYSGASVPQEFERSRHVTGATLQDEWAPAGGRIVMVGSYRRREARDNYFGPPVFGRPPAARATPHDARLHGPMLGARVDAGHGLALRVSRSSDARFPTLYELFGTGGEVRTNPALAPEHGVTWDAGLSWRRDSETGSHLALEATAFRSSRDSLIVLVQNSQRNFTAQNLERAAVSGLEMHGDFALGRRITFDGAWTVEKARQESAVPHWDGRWLPYVSPHEFQTHTTLRTGPWEWRHEYWRSGAYFQDRANLPQGRVAPGGLHNLGANLRLAGLGASIDFDLQNVFDRPMQDVYGYPMPGRMLYVTLDFKVQRQDG